MKTGETSISERFIEAVEGGDLITVKDLLEEEVDVNQGLEKGYTPLIIATAHEHKMIVQTLLEKGANVNQQTTDSIKITALMFAAANGHIEFVNDLLNKGANPNLAENDGFTALMFAAANGQEKIVNDLLNHAAKPNTKDAVGDTALMLAAAKGHETVVKLLLDKGANPNIKNKVGNTALILAVGNGHIDCVNALLNAEADVNKQNKKGETALMLAAANRHVEIVNALLEKGADVHIQNESGYTALMIAAANKPAACAHTIRRAIAIKNDALIKTAQEKNVSVLNILGNTELMMLIKSPPDKMTANRAAATLDKAIHALNDKAPKEILWDMQVYLLKSEYDASKLQCYENILKNLKRDPEKSSFGLFDKPDLSLSQYWSKEIEKQKTKEAKYKFISSLLVETIKLFSQTEQDSVTTVRSIIETEFSKLNDKQQEQVYQGSFFSIYKCDVEKLVDRLQEFFSNQRTLNQDDYSGNSIELKEFTKPLT